MRKISAFILAFSACGTSFAQSAAPAKTAPPASSKLHQTAVGGQVTDARKHPILGVEAFIYQPDSTIIASGYTDSAGNYQTNSVLPGKYDVKIVYPTSKTILIKGVVIKNGVTQLSFKQAPPADDTVLQYADLVPKPVVKKKAK